MRFHKDENISNLIRIEEDKLGPRVVLFSGVHGDEVSGVHAIEKLFFDADHLTGAARPFRRKHRRVR